MGAAAKGRTGVRPPRFPSSELALVLSSASVIILGGGCRRLVSGWSRDFQLPACLRFALKTGKFDIAARHRLLIIKALQRAALHSIAEDPFDVADHLPVFAGHEGEGIAGLGGTSRAPDAVRVGISGVGHIVIDDVGYA